MKAIFLALFLSLALPLGALAALPTDLHNVRGSLLHHLHEGLEQNRLLTQYVDSLRETLEPHRGATLLFDESWAAPIRSTTARFAKVLSQQDISLEALAAEFRELSIQALFQPGSCQEPAEAVYLLQWKYQDLWGARRADTEALTEKLQELASLPRQKQGMIPVDDSLLGALLETASASRERQNQFQNRLKEADGQFRGAVRELGRCLGIE